MPKQHQQTGTHIQTAAHLGHRYATVVFTVFFSQAVSARESNFVFFLFFYWLSNQTKTFHFTPTKALTRIGQTKQYSTLQDIAIFILTRKNAPLIISPL